MNKCGGHRRDGQSHPCARREPEVEIYDAGHLDIAIASKRGPSRSASSAVRARGAGALSASERNLEPIWSSASTELGVPCTWGVAGIGPPSAPNGRPGGIAWGGNARVGLEDNIYLDKGVLAEGSAPLVARAVELCRKHGRKVATTAEARTLLGLPTRA